jgi:hypothetical protein
MFSSFQVWESRVRIAGRRLMIVVFAYLRLHAGRILLNGSNVVETSSLKGIGKVCKGAMRSNLVCAEITEES